MLPASEANTAEMTKMPRLARVASMPETCAPTSEPCRARSARPPGGFNWWAPGPSGGEQHAADDPVREALARQGEAEQRERRHAHPVGPAGEGGLGGGPERDDGGTAGA